MQYTFALAIIKQFSENGTKGPKLTLINIPGRTVNALSHQWQAMRKDLISLPVGEAGGSDNTATKPATAKAGKRKIKAGEEDNDTEEPSKKKRGPAKKGTSAKKIDAAKDNQESEETEVDTEHERGVKTEMKASVKKSGAKKKTISSASDGEGEKEKIPAKGRGKKKAATPNSEGDVEGEEKKKKKTAPKRKPSAAAKKGVKKTKAEVRTSARYVTTFGTFQSSTLSLSLSLETR